MDARALAHPVGNTRRRAILAGVLVVLPLLGVVLWLAQKDGAAEATAALVPPDTNVILIVCDTLRADHLGFQGYSRSTSPFLDSLAQRAQVYENAYSHFSYTWPTVSNLFTGLPFSALSQKGLFVSPGPGLESGGLSPKNRTLAQVLARAGVRSAAVSANPYINSRLGFSKGFQDFHDVYRWNPNFWNEIRKYTAKEVNQAAFSMLDKLEAGGGPWLLYLHYFDTHMPYLAPAEDQALFVDPAYKRTEPIRDGYLWNRKGDKLQTFLSDETKGWVDSSDITHLVNLYDAELYSLDRGLAELFVELEARGTLDRTVVILTADHGEAFFERGFWGHGFFSRVEEEHVPLLIIPPSSTANVQPARISEAATTTDVHYSILRHFGALPKEAADVAWWSVDVLSGQRRHATAYSEGAHSTIVLRGARYSYYRQLALTAAQAPIPVRDGEYLFDRERDPGETRNLFDADPKRAAALRDQLLLGLGTDVDWLPTGWGDPMLRPHDPEAARRLRALGYL